MPESGCQSAPVSARSRRFLIHCGCARNRAFRLVRASLSRRRGGAGPQQQEFCRTGGYLGTLARSDQTEFAPRSRLRAESLAPRGGRGHPQYKRASSALQPGGRSRLPAGLARFRLFRCFFATVHPGAVGDPGGRRFFVRGGVGGPGPSPRQDRRAGVRSSELGCAVERFSVWAARLAESPSSELQAPMLLAELGRSTPLDSARSPCGRGARTSGKVRCDHCDGLARSRYGNRHEIALGFHRRPPITTRSASRTPQSVQRNSRAQSIVSHRGAVLCSLGGNVGSSGD